MSKAAVWLGLVLGLVSLVGGVQGYLTAGSAASLAAGLAAGILLVGAASLARGGRAWAQVVLCVVALALLGRFLPLYFKTYRPWPALVVVLLGSFTFGLGILGLLLDRYRPRVPGRPGPPRGGL